MKEKKKVSLVYTFIFRFSESRCENTKIGIDDTQIKFYLNFSTKKFFL